MAEKLEASIGLVGVVFRVRLVFVFAFGFVFGFGRSIDGQTFVVFVLCADVATRAAFKGGAAHLCLSMTQLQV
jgi:hypothetical protein